VCFLATEEETATTPSLELHPYNNHSHSGMEGGRAVRPNLNKVQQSLDFKSAPPPRRVDLVCWSKKQFLKKGGGWGGGAGFGHNLVV
jgi:hypothetical protein